MVGQESHRSGGSNYRSESRHWPFLLDRITLPAIRESLGHSLSPNPPRPMDTAIYGCIWSRASVLPTRSPRKAMRNGSNSSPDPCVRSYQSRQRKVWMLHFTVVTLSTCGGWGLGKGTEMLHGLLKRNPGWKCVCVWGMLGFFNVSLSLPTAPSIFRSWLLPLCNSVLFICDCLLVGLPTRAVLSIQQPLAQWPLSTWIWLFQIQMSCNIWNFKVLECKKDYIVSQ